MTTYYVSRCLPALGDIRSLGAGDTVLINPNIRSHKDWQRYVSAIADAVSKGASVTWTLEES